MRWWLLLVILVVGATAVFWVEIIAWMSPLNHLHQEMVVAFPELSSIKIRLGKKNQLIDRRIIEIDRGMKYTREKMRFIVLHELAHCFCTSFDQHDDEFMKIFSDLLWRADRAGLGYQEAEVERGIPTGRSS